MRHATLSFRFEHHLRRVRIVVPAKVEESPPVLVMFDGQNALGDAGSFAGGWHADRAVAKLPSTVRRPVIVAVDHGGVHRNHELWAGLTPMLAFIVDRVLPAAEHACGHVFDPRARAIGGASLGGLASLAAMARYPHVFTGAIAMSPSVWFAAPILRELAHARFAPWARAYVDVGYRESVKMVREASRVPPLLHTRMDDARVMWRPDQRGKHRELDWRRRLPKALRFVFHR